MFATSAKPLFLAIYYDKCDFNLKILDKYSVYDILLTEGRKRFSKNKPTQSKAGKANNWPENEPDRVPRIILGERIDQRNGSFRKIRYSLATSVI